MSKKKGKESHEEEELLEVQEPMEATNAEEDSTPVEETPPSKRSLFLDRMKSRNPEVDYDDEDARYGAFLDFDDEREGRISRLEESDTRMKELLKKDPKFAQMIMEVANGEDAAVAFARHFGDLMNLDMEDPEVAERVVAENQERIARLAKEEEDNKLFEETRNKNLSASGENISKFIEEKGIDDEKAKEMIELYVRIANEGITGEVTEETLNILFRGMSYDDAIGKAREDGLTEGRNERVDRNSMKRKGDGIPHLSAEGSSTPLSERENGGLSSYRGRRSMYDMK